MKITLKGVASYKNPVVIESDKEVNLIYGLNGTGKTIISNYLYKNNNSNSDFSECELEGVNNEKLLVYNQDFIHDEFYDDDKVKGVFTLSEENKQANQAIDEAHKKIEQFTKQKEIETQNSAQKEESLQKESLKVKNSLWDIKEQYTGGDRVLEFCLEGLKGDKNNLFEYIINITRPNSKPEKTIEGLKEEAKTISDEAQKIKICLKSILT